MNHHTLVLTIIWLGEGYCLKRGMDHWVHMQSPMVDCGRLSPVHSSSHFPVQYTGDGELVPQRGDSSHSSITKWGIRGILALCANPWKHMGHRSQMQFTLLPITFAFHCTGSSTMFPCAAVVLNKTKHFTTSKTFLLKNISKIFRKQWTEENFSDKRPQEPVLLESLQ